MFARPEHPLVDLSGVYGGVSSTGEWCGRPGISCSANVSLTVLLGLLLPIFFLNLSGFFLSFVVWCVAGEIPGLGVNLHLFHPFAAAADGGPSELDIHHRATSHLIR